MKSKEKRIWNGPWPWTLYLATYSIPWLWLYPSFLELLLTLLGLAIFVFIFVTTFEMRGRSLIFAIVALVALAMLHIPAGGGWSALALYPAMQAAKLRPRYAAIQTIILVMFAFLVGGLFTNQPYFWWLPSLLTPLFVAGITLSRETLLDHAHALQTSQEEVRRLAELAERERMARDLHDVIGRTLTLVALKADLVRVLAKRDSDAALREVNVIAAEARAGLAEVRAALAGQFGASFPREIAVSVKALEAAGINIEVMDGDAALPSDAGAILAMTLREAITNVIRHASAKKCSISVAREGKRLRLLIHDDGDTAEFQEGNGLTGMRQRLIAAGGSLVLQTNQPGTILIAEVPT